MLSWSCRRFRARFTPGAAAPHRRACPDCDAYAAALERAAGVRLPLPPSLQGRLRALAAPEPGAVLPFPVPRLPVPDALAARLRSIAPARPAPPEWVRSPRLAIAASIVLALLLGPVLAGAADRGERALQLAHQLAHEEVTPLLDDASAQSRRELTRLRLAAGAAGDTAAQSMHRLQAGLSSLSNRWSAVVAEFKNPIPPAEAGGSSRRSR
ncbi:MAG TPA: hypothetical protein VFC23_05535 [Thermoanaerobaculia bacterium]|nr:hypothetical protein [Thermoanaerobaculia bacterium]